MPTKNKKWQRQKDSHLVTSYPKAAVCPSCHRHVLAGYDVGFHTLYDVHRLSQIGEAEALAIHKLRVYLADFPSFERRTAHSLKTKPTISRGFLVREHRCGTPNPLSICLAPQATTEELPDEAPF